MSDAVLAINAPGALVCPACAAVLGITAGPGEAITDWSGYDFEPGAGPVCDTCDRVLWPPERCAPVVDHLRSVSQLTRGLEYRVDDTGPYVFDRETTRRWPGEHDEIEYCPTCYRCVTFERHDEHVCDRGDFRSAAVRYAEYRAKLARAEADPLVSALARLETTGELPF